MTINIEQLKASDAENLSRLEGLPPNRTELDIACEVKVVDLDGSEITVTDLS